MTKNEELRKAGLQLKAMVLCTRIKWFDLEGFAFYPIAWQPLPAPYQPKGE